VLTSEHRIYPQSVSWFVHGLLRVEGGVVRHAQGASQLLV
jgi:folate-dependent phosphoribosylglycinamide formyltransferase PurN